MSIIGGSILLGVLLLVVAKCILRAVVRLLPHTFVLALVSLLQHTLCNPSLTTHTILLVLPALLGSEMCLRTYLASCLAERMFVNTDCCDSIPDSKSPQERKEYRKFLDDMHHGDFVPVSFDSTNCSHTSCY